MTHRRPLIDFGFFERRRELGPLVIRLFAGGTIVWMCQDNVFSWHRMLEFRDFLAARDVIYPLFAACLSVYVQFACGILFVLGLFTRHAAVAMVVNFIAALMIAHVGLPFQANIPPLAMLASSLFLLFHGPGALSLDAMLARRNPEQASTRRAAA